jgi:Ca2+-binding RTX toxin-like protein
MATPTFLSLADFLARKATLVGDSGVDALSFVPAGSGVVFNDATLGGMTAALPNATTQFEELVLPDFASSVTLGANAMAVGLRSLSGGAQNDVIRATGYTIAVSLSGDGGNDTLGGGSGADTLDGGIGADRLEGGAGNDFYLIDDAGDVVVEGMAAGSGTDSVLLNVSGGHTLAGNVEHGILGTGDQLTGNTVNNSLIGNASANTLNAITGAAGGNDTLIGLAGDDFYVINTGDVVIESVGEGNDSVEARVTGYTLANHVEHLILGTGIVSGTGNALNNSLIGNTSNNSLNGGAGVDSLIGGGGNDTYVLDQSGNFIFENAGEGTDLAVVNFSGGYTLADQVENLTLGTGNAGTGNASNNLLTGNSLDNTLDGGGGIDTLVGLAGSDFYVVDHASDVVTEGSNAGTDSVLVNVNGGYLLGNNIEHGILGTGDQVTGNGLANSLIGNGSSNTLNGGAGIDTLSGAGGNDYYIIDQLADLVLETSGQGIDSVQANVNNATLADHAEWMVFNGTVARGTGNALDNTLLGNSVANTLDGGAGADSLSGGGGNDAYFVDHAGDVVHELLAQGTDTVNVSTITSYTLGNHVENLVMASTVVVAGTGNSLANSMVGNSLDNTLDGAGGIDTLVGLAGNDFYIVDHASDVVTEGVNAGTDSVLVNVSGGYLLGNNVEHGILGTGDQMTGNTSANSLIGNSSNNTLNGGTGNDTLAGLGGNDYYVIDALLDVILESSGQGTDSVLANITNATLAENAEWLIFGSTIARGTGNSVANTLVGNSLANTLDGGAGADSLAGGDGNDTYFVDHLGDIVLENTSQGIDGVNVSGIDAYTLPNHVENLVLSASSGLSGTGNSLNNTLSGNSLNNFLSGAAGLDTLIAAAGDDTLDGGAGVDSMVGGLGNDFYIMDLATDVVIEAAGQGTDSVRVDFNNSTLVANAEVLILGGGAGIFTGTGNSLSNTLVGNSLGNTLDGGTGSDRLIGAGGNDYYLVDNAADVVVEVASEGTDSVLASVNNHTLSDHVEYLILASLPGILSGNGGATDNFLIGNSLNNTLSAGNGDDTVDGGVGNDSLEGGSGNDSLVGGTGDDTLSGSGGNDTLNGGLGADRASGGQGDDLYFVDSTSDVVVESASQGIDSVLASISGVTLGANVEYLELTGTAVAGTGNTAANTLVGNSLGNSLDGGAGVDSLVGGAGNDTYFVDQATDAILEENIVGSGVDIVFSSATTYLLGDNLEALVLAGSARGGTGNELANTLTGNSLGNTLSGAGGADTLLGLDGGDTLDGGEDAAADSLVGGVGNDYYILRSGDILLESSGEGTDSVLSYLTSTILGNHLEHLILGTGATSGTGNSLNNSLFGNAENNTLAGDSGADTFAGGDGDDYYVVADATDRVIEAVDAGLDTVLASHNNHILANHVENLVLAQQAGVLNGSGNSLDNFLTGNSLNNSMTGAGGNDTLLADAGNDTLQGGTGDDSLVGGGGNDLYYVDSLFDSVLEVSAGGTDSVVASVEGYVLADEVEYLLINGGYLSGSGNSGHNTLVGNIGHNSLEGLGGNDTILGGSGNDSLLGGAGDDSLVGGTGDDFYEVDSASDVIVETSGAGADTVLAHLTAYSLGSNLEHLMLGTGAISGTGNALSNSILGNASGNSLDGGAGADTLAGGDGHDTYFVDSLLDVLVESDGEGNDVVITGLNGYQLATNLEGLLLTGSATLGYGSDQDNTLTGNTIFANRLEGRGGNDTLIGGSGADSLDGGSGADSLIGAAGDDFYVVDDPNDRIFETSGTDSVLVNVSGGYTLDAGLEHLLLGTGDSGTGNAGNNSLIGNSLNNTLNGFGGVNTLTGGLGDDYYVVNSLSDIVIEMAGEGIDTVVSNVDGYVLGAHIENFVASPTTISIVGGDGSNLLVGNALNNSIDGGLGADTMVGAGGNDFYLVDDLGDRTVENASEGTDSVLANVISYTLADHMEVLVLGTRGITGIGNSLNNTLIGNSTYNSLSGGDGNDWLVGTGGANTLNGGTGADTMIGGAGNDYFVVDNAGDSLVGGGGNDGVIAMFNYTLSADFNVLVLGGTAATGTGNANNNSLTGNSMDNTLTGGGGADTMTGRGGNDYYVVDSADDFVIEASLEGYDSVASTISTYTLTNNVEILVLSAGAEDGVGNSMANTLIGNADQNFLTGAGGRDSLTGGAGNDSLLGASATSSGGRGEIDTLTGGSDSDVFILGVAAGVLYNDGLTTNSGLADYAYITDFTPGQDVLQLKGAASSYYLGAHSVSALVAHQGLFLETGTTDELIAIIQTGGAALTATNTIQNAVFV